MLLLSGDVAAQDSLAADTLKPDFITDGPWVYTKPLGSEEVSNDSLLRWQIWPGWSDWQAYRPGVVSYRQGTLGRLDAFMVDAYEPRFQKHYWQGLELNDPVSGFFNANYVPHHKLLGVDERKRVDHQLHYRLTHYYSRQPVTQLNFDESKYKYRNLEFLFSRNFTPRSNIELSFWDRRDGDAFVRSDVQGTQVYMKGTHQFNKKWLMHASWLNNRFEREESFGYNVPDPATFAFSRFNTVALQNGASSEVQQSIIRAGLHHKKADDRDEDFRFSLHRKFDLRLIDIVGVENGYEVVDLGANAWKRLKLGNKLNLDLGARADLFRTRNNNVLNLDEWSQLEGNTELQIRPLSGISLSGKSVITVREDRSVAMQSGQISISPIENMELHAAAGFGEKLPSIQSLYWNSGGFTGDENLENERVLHSSAGIKFNLFGTTEIGAEGAFRSIENGVLPTPDSTFVNVGSYDVTSATAFFRLDSFRWEWFANATIKQFSSGGTQMEEQRINALDPVMLGRGGFYYKAPIYNSAAFLKAGLEGVISPAIVQTYSFQTETGVWNLINNNADNPAWFRLDANISARLRSMFFVMRFENVLDGFGQAGYFESVGYPMPPRRFILGIRVLFKN
jgi:hypothetical protein